MANITPRRFERCAPWLVCGLLKYVAVICTFKFFLTWTPLELWWLEEPGSQKLRAKKKMTAPLLITITQGGFHVFKKFKTSKSQLRALATHTPIWGRVAQGALELCLPQIRKCHFWMTHAFLNDPCIFEWPLCVWMYLLRKGAYRDFLYIILSLLHWHWACFTEPAFWGGGGNYTWNHRNLNTYL